MSGFSDAPGNQQQTGWTTIEGPDGKEIDVFVVEGSDPNIPPEERRRALRESIGRIRKIDCETADLLYRTMMMAGIEHQLEPEDIKAFCATQKTPRGRSPMLMQKIMVEFILILRDERRYVEAVNVQGALSLPG